LRIAHRIKGLELSRKGMFKIPSRCIQSSFLMLNLTSTLKMLQIFSVLKRKAAYNFFT